MKRNFSFFSYNRTGTKGCQKKKNPPTKFSFVNKTCFTNIETKLSVYHRYASNTSHLSFDADTENNKSFIRRVRKKAHSESSD